MDIFPHWLIEGFTPTAHADFPSLFKDRFEVSYSIGTGVRVFNSTSKKESIMITLGIQKETYLSIEQLRGGGHKLVSFNYPFYTKKFSIVSYSIPGERTRFVKGGGPQRELWNKHEADVDYLMSKLGESGLLVNVSTDDMEIFYSQPVIELLDKTNGETIKCLGSLAVIAKVSTTSTPRGERETTTPQTHVPPRGVCLNIRDELIFGRPYRVQNGKYLFEKIPSISSCEATRLGIVELLKLSQSVKYTQWHSSLEISRLVGISPSSVWAIFGEVWIRFGKFQEEVGMNIWSYSSHGEPQCVPGYSRFVPSVGKEPSKRRWNKWDKPNRFEWVFSLHAVAALRQLISDQPELVAEIEQTVVGVSDSQIDGGITIQGKRLFSRMRRPSTVAFGNRDDWISEFHLSKLVSYINSKPFKNLSICNWQYEHIDSAFVPLIDSFITRLRAELDLLPGGSGTVNLHSIDEKFLYPLTQQTVYNSLKFSSPPVIGQRGIYIKSRGVVEVGSWGTIIGVYGVDRDQRLDILLDIPSLNASSLNGTCPDMKGIRISASDWRAFPDQFRTPPVKDMEITKLRNKILADLIIHMGKSGIPAPSSDQQAKAEILAMLKPKAIGGHPVAHSASADVGGRIDSSTAQQGARKVSVNDLFSSSRPLGSSESSTSAVAARRLQPPTVMLHKDLVAQLHAPRVSTQPPGTGSTNNSPPKIPDFLLSKLRQPPKKE
jgi:hypothetical protein